MATDPKCAPPPRYTHSDTAVTSKNMSRHFAASVVVVAAVSATQWSSSAVAVRSVVRAQYDGKTTACCAHAIIRASRV